LAAKRQPFHWSGGELQVSVGHALIDEYLQFLTARARPNTRLAVAFDLKVFFSVIDKTPVRITSGRRDGVLRAARGQPDRGPHRRLGRPVAPHHPSAAVVGLGLLRLPAGRGDTSVFRNPVRPPAGKASDVGRPLVRAVTTLPRVLAPAEVDALVGVLHTARDRAMVDAMVLGGLRRCEVLGLRLEDIRLGERRVFIADGKGGRQRLIPMSSRFFSSLARYLDEERPAEASNDAVFVVLKGPRRSEPLSAYGLDEVLRGARQRAGLSHGTCHEAAPHLPDASAGGGHVARNPPGPGRPRLHRDHPRLPPSGRRLAGGRVPQGGGSHRGPSPAGATVRPAQALAAVAVAAEVPAPWAAIHAAAPQVATTMVAYVAQIGVSMRPSTAKAVETELRIFTGFLLGHDPALAAVADIERSDIEAFKLWQWAQPGTFGRLKPATFRRRFGQLRTFFLRITEWGRDDAPARVPIFFGDVPKRDEPLPRFLDDARFTKFMRALADEPVIRRRVAIEVLARTGMRVGELCGLEADAVTLIGDAHWLRVPLGKLRNDRYVPLHPHLVELLALYRRSYGAHDHGRLLSGEQGPLNRYAVQRWITAPPSVTHGA
jgi:integrase/recombinase XerD